MIGVGVGGSSGTSRPLRQQEHGMSSSSRRRSLLSSSSSSSSSTYFIFLGVLGLICLILSITNFISSTRNAGIVGGDNAAAPLAFDPDEGLPTVRQDNNNDKKKKKKISILQSPVADHEDATATTTKRRTKEEEEEEKRVNGNDQQRKRRRKRRGMNKIMMMGTTTTTGNNNKDDEEEEENDEEAQENQESDSIIITADAIIEPKPNKDKRRQHKQENHLEGPTTTISTADADGITHDNDSEKQQQKQKTKNKRRAKKKKVVAHEVATEQEQQHQPAEQHNQEEHSSITSEHKEDKLDNNNNSNSNNQRRRRKRKKEQPKEPIDDNKVVELTTDAAAAVDKEDVRPATTAVETNDGAADVATPSPKSETATTTDQQQQQEHDHSQPLLTKQGLLQQLQIQKTKLRSKLINIYTEKYYWDIFEPKITAATGGGETTKRISIGDHHLYKSPKHLTPTKMGEHQPPVFSTTNNNNDNDSDESPSSKSKSSLGWNRMIRLLQIKLLQMQLSILKQQQASSTTSTPAPPTILKWVTAGNGKASGSGNFFRESYTAILETALQPAFEALGGGSIKFVAQNYAMKFLSSGDELALCQQYIFPPSVDIMYWDFDMTDEKDYWKLALFGHRLAAASATSNSTTNTALIAYQRQKGHTKVLMALEELGMTVLGKDWKIQLQQEMSYPDSMSLPEIELQALPPHLRYIRCGKEIEDGGSAVIHNGITKKLCRAYKFNVTVCPERPHKYIWHPSFRTNAIKGYSLAMMILEITQDAIEQLPDFDNDNDNDDTNDNQVRMKQVQQELERLQQAERIDYQGVYTAKPKGLGKWYEEEENVDAFHQEIDMLSIFRSPALCRTALLPSRSRYYFQPHGKGLQVTTPYNDTYERGTFLGKLRSQDIKNVKKGGFRYSESWRSDEMPLATDKSGYFDCPEEPLLIDHQDSFLVTSKMGWRSLSIPNDRESQQFGDMTKVRGWIFICLFICDNSKCPDEDLHDRVHDKPTRPEQGDPLTLIEEYGRVEMEVNGIPVSKYTRLIEKKTSHLDNCLALRKATPPQHTWEPNKDGKFVLRARIVGAEEWGYLKISSVIVM